MKSEVKSPYERVQEWRAKNPELSLEKSLTHLKIPLGTYYNSRKKAADYNPKRRRARVPKTKMQTLLVPEIPHSSNVIFMIVSQNEAASTLRSIMEL